MPEDKKEEDLIKLEEAGGEATDLFFLDKLHEIQEDIAEKSDNLSVEVTNLPEVQRVEIINHQEQHKCEPIVNVPAPVVNVEAPIVNVDAPVLNVDTSKVENTLEEVSLKISDLSDQLEGVLNEKGDRLKVEVDKVGTGGGISNAPRGVLNATGTRINPATEETLAGTFAIKVTTSGTTTYVAKAAIASSQASAVWQAQKIDKSSGVVITWADGNANFDNVATDLTALTYS